MKSPLGGSSLSVKQVHGLTRSTEELRERRSAYPGGGVLEDVGLELLHKDHVVEDYDGVILALTDQDVLKSLIKQEKREQLDQSYNTMHK